VQRSHVPFTLTVFTVQLSPQEPSISRTNPDGQVVQVLLSLHVRQLSVELHGYKMVSLGKKFGGMVGVQSFVTLLR
jgi:hypothetical protein